MKKVLLVFLTFGSLSSFAGPIDKIANGGSYYPTSTYCGIETEKLGNTLVLTFKNNRLNSRSICYGVGKSYYVDCSQYSRSCYARDMDFKLDILDDGNFVITESDGEKTKYFRF